LSRDLSDLGCPAIYESYGLCRTIDMHVGAEKTEERLNTSRWALPANEVGGVIRFSR